jgi:hypothetical protein
MRGEFLGVWDRTWVEVWQDLSQHESAPDDLFCELYRELSDGLFAKPTIETLADIIDDLTRSREVFEATNFSDFRGERVLVRFLENAYSIIEDVGGDPLANYYFTLLSDFIEKFSLRYDLRRPCELCPTIQGVFANLMRDLRLATGRDAYLDSLMKDFETAIRDLRTNTSEGRIKTCIQKQMNLLEAIGQNSPGVTGNTLGAICDQVGTWPHEKVKEAMKSLYAFSCNYPGIRHAGTPANALRGIDMKDLVAISIMLVGFAPYLTDKVDSIVVYSGS